MSDTKSIVVVGAGQAGATLVQRLRELGFDGTLTMIGAEPHLPINGRLCQKPICLAI